MLTAIFYLLVALLAAYDFLILINTKAHAELMLRIQNFKNTAFNEKSKEEKREIIYPMFIFLLTFTVLFIGLFSFQWPLFLAYFVIIVITSAVFKGLKKIKNKGLYYVFTFIDALICFCFWVFLIINHYHLKINVLNLF